MSSARRFQKELASCPGRTYRAKCFRVVELEAYAEHEEPKLLFDLGPKISEGGQRFSPPGDHRGLYVSAELTTAGSEFADGSRAWKRGDCAKHVTFNIQVALASVLDLTNPATRRHLRTSKREIQSAWEGHAELLGTWPPTWTLGHETFVSGRFDGILFPSTKSAKGSCLLVFTERLVGGKTGVTLHRANGEIWEQLP